MKRRDYKPAQLYELLKRSVIGQDDYIKKLSTCIWLHNKRIEAKEKYFLNDVQKSNLLVVGPTGSGKTMSVSILAGIYGFDVHVADMSTFTGAGWKGRDSQEIIQDLYHQCGDDIERTEKAIVIMDEIDKALLQNSKGDEASFAVEHSLLKLIEGTKVEITKSVHIDTKNILFIASGAFEGIEYEVRDRVAPKVMGFLGNVEKVELDSNEIYQSITKDDLRRYGVGSQFLGRFSDIAVLNRLEEKDLVNILRESQSSVVRSYSKMLRYSCCIAVSIDEEGAAAVAKQAIKQKTGARGLAQIITPLVNDALFQNENGDIRHLIITAKDGVPSVDIKRGERFKVFTSGKDPKKYSFPNPKAKNVEMFSWRVLSYYLEEIPQAYSIIRAMHTLLCSMVFFVLMECNNDEHTVKSLQKLTVCAGFDSDNTATRYEFMLDEHFDDNPVPLFQVYYRKYKELDPGYKAVSLLQEALNKFREEGDFRREKTEKEKKKTA